MTVILVRSTTRIDLAEYARTVAALIRSGDGSPAGPEPPE